jgi:hypothetical protein
VHLRSGGTNQTRLIPQIYSRPPRRPFFVTYACYAYVASHEV